MIGQPVCASVAMTGISATRVRMNVVGTADKMYVIVRLVNAMDHVTPGISIYRAVHLVQMAAMYRAIRLAEDVLDPV